MKKIMFFIRAFPSGGAEKLLLDIIKRMDKSKYDITVYSRGKYGELADEFEKYAKCKLCFSHLTPGTNYKKKLYNYLIIHVSEALLNVFPKFYYRNAIKEKFDVEIAFKNDESTKIIASSSNRKSKKLQWIHTDIARHEGWRLYFKSQKERKRYLKKYDKIIGVSDLVKNSVDQVFQNELSTCTVYNLVDRDEIIEKSKEQVCMDLVNSEWPIMISVGRVEFEKRFDILIKIHKRLIDEGIFHYLIIVGEGREKKNLQLMSKELGVEDTVRFVGYQENPYKYIQISDFSVCTSLYEGFHLASAESLVLGKPVVSCCPVVGELMGDEACGILCGYSENEIYQSIRKILTETETLKKMKLAALKRSMFFDGMRVIREIEKVIDEL